jgi:hypothetical protein
MGRKSSSKGRGQTPGASKATDTPVRAGGPSPLVLVVVLVAIVGVGLLAFWRPQGEPDGAAATPGAGAPSGQPVASAAAVEKAAAVAKLGPRDQASFPPIPFQPGSQPPRSPQIVTAAYEFAAEHPEILSYVPCFCGCERSGHQGNHDCFVKQRAENGDVIAWDEHGVECLVCIDVANRSRQMHASGASVRDIRAAIDKEFGGLYPTGRNMATPHPH